MYCEHGGCGVSVFPKLETVCLKVQAVLQNMSLYKMFRFSPHKFMDGSGEL